MNKLAVVLGVAAVATFAGCKDPQYARVTPAPQDEVKNVETESTSGEVKTAEVKETASTCKCAPGTRHNKPCECGSPDCQCIVQVQSVAPEYTIYIVQRGDFLAKISKKFNLTIDSIKKLNNLKSDSVRLGQKLKLPGKIDVGEQKVPEGAVKKAAPKKAYESYKGETKEYVVVSGDTLGKIAYSNGMNIRQLKELNGLKKDSLRIGQKLKVAAGKAEVKNPVVVQKTEVTAPVVEEKTEEVKPAEAVPVNEVKPVAETKPEESAPTEGATRYVVQEGDTLPRIAIDYEVPVARIRELNNLGEGDEVKVGQVLKIPAAQ